MRNISPSWYQTAQANVGSLGNMPSTRAEPFRISDFCPENASRTYSKYCPLPTILHSHYIFLTQKTKYERHFRMTFSHAHEAPEKRFLQNSLRFFPDRRTMKEIDPHSCPFKPLLNATVRLFRSKKSAFSMPYNRRFWQRKARIRRRRCCVSRIR